MAPLRRAVGAASRRLGRPELLSAFDAHARREQQEAIAISAVLAATLRVGSTYVDVGANRGQVLSEAARIAPQARRIAFEPIPSLAAGLASRFPGLDCRAKALGARAEQARFCHFRSLDGWSGLRRSPEISDEQGQPELIDVEVSTLDAELAAERPSVIKIDVEGAELGVLEGGRTLLGEARPLLIFEHVAQAAALYESSSQTLWELLEELGYNVFAVTGEGPFSRADFAADSTIVNWLAAPRESLATSPGAAAQQGSATG
jgi:FkbM family methyltransferase